MVISPVVFFSTVSHRRARLIQVCSSGPPEQKVADGIVSVTTEINSLFARRLHNYQSGLFSSGFSSNSYLFYISLSNPDQAVLCWRKNHNPKHVQLSLTERFQMIGACVAPTSLTAGPTSAVEEGCSLFPAFLSKALVLYLPPLISLNTLPRCCRHQR